MAVEIVSGRVLRERFSSLCHGLGVRTAFDIGAYNGTDSIALKARVPELDVYAFEANPVVHSKNLKRAEKAGVTYLNNAISNKEDKLTLYEMAVDTPENIYDWRRGSSSLYLRKEGKREYVEHEVDAFTLSSFIERQNILGPFGLWIDVEGASRDVLEGSKDTLSDVLLINIEVESQTVWKGQSLDEEIISFIEQNGFSMVMKTDPTQAQYDCCFINFSLF